MSEACFGCAKGIFAHLVASEHDGAKQVNTAALVLAMLLARHGADIEIGTPGWQAQWIAGLGPWLTENVEKLNVAAAAMEAREQPAGARH